ncbi:MAG TPA: MgtC/SapB family protein [Stellaceae bacterium]|nr:MgtC/SapB family protein [Stellaceae bacterium]
MSADTFINITLAILLGALIGFERQWNQGMAGLRTNALVAFGSACFVTIGTHVGSDRVAAQIVSGIGFLGAGVILHEGPTVRGLNTAATLWCAAAVGSLCATGLRWEGLYAGFSVVVLNIGLRHVQIAIHRYAPHPGDIETLYTVDISCAAAEAATVQLRFVHDAAGAGLQLNTLHQEPLDEPDGMQLVAELVSHSRRDKHFDALIAKTRDQAGVNSVRWDLATRRGT